MPIGLRIRGLFEDLPRRAVAHADDAQATVSSVAPLSFKVVYGVYAGFTVGSYLPYVVRRYWQDSFCHVHTKKRHAHLSFKKSLPPSHLGNVQTSLTLLSVCRRLSIVKRLGED